MSAKNLHEEMIKDLPDYERKSALINQIVYSIASKFNGLNASQLENQHELFIDTAVKALQIHARDLGISIGSKLGLRQQRELIMAYYRASFEQTNADTIKNIAASFSNGEVEINFTDTAGIFEMKFVGSVGIPDNMGGLKSAIEMIIPAHLAFIYTFVYNTHQKLKVLTHSDLNKMTNDAIRNEVLNNGRAY